MTVRSHKELTAYQRGYRLVLQIYKLTAGFPAAEQFGLTSQMRRCAVSIPSNIAEGWARGSREYAQFLRVAAGSAAELDTQLALSRDLGFCPEDAYTEAAGLVEEVMKLLRTYIVKIAAHGKTIAEDPASYNLDH